MNSLYNNRSRRFINPAERNELFHWADTWGISVRELENAIIETGKTNVPDLKNYFMQQGPFVFMLKSCAGFTRVTIRQLGQQLAELTRRAIQKMKTDDD